MWLGEESGGRTFSGGQEAWSAAAELACICQNLRADDEDEQCAEEEFSCYNCCYRRWTADSFTCQAT